MFDDIKSIFSLAKQLKADWQEYMPFFEDIVNHIKGIQAAEENAPQNEFHQSFLVKWEEFKAEYDALEAETAKPKPSSINSLLLVNKLVKPLQELLIAFRNLQLPKRLANPPQSLEDLYQKVERYALEHMSTEINWVKEKWGSLSNSLENFAELPPIMQDVLLYSAYEFNQKARELYQKINKLKLNFQGLNLNEDLFVKKLLDRYSIDELFAAFTDTYKKCLQEAGYVINQNELYPYYFDQLAQNEEVLKELEQKLVAHVRDKKKLSDDHKEVIKKFKLDMAKSKTKTSVLGNIIAKLEENISLPKALEEVGEEWKSLEKSKQNSAKKIYHAVQKLADEECVVLQKEHSLSTKLYQLKPAIAELREKIKSHDNSVVEAAPVHQIHKDIVSQALKTYDHVREMIKRQLEDSHLEGSLLKKLKNQIHSAEDSLSSMLDDAVYAKCIAGYKKVEGKAYTNEGWIDSVVDLLAHAKNLLSEAEKLEDSFKKTERRPHADLIPVTKEFSLILSNPNGLVMFNQLAGQQSNAVGSLSGYGLKHAGQENLNEINKVILQGEGRLTQIINLLKKINTPLSREGDSQRYLLSALGQDHEEMMLDYEKIAQDKFKSCDIFTSIYAVHFCFVELMKAARGASQFINTLGEGVPHGGALLSEINALIQDFYLLADSIEKQFYLKEGCIAKYPLYNMPMLDEASRADYDRSYKESNDKGIFQESEVDREFLFIYAKQIFTLAKQLQSSCKTPEMRPPGSNPGQSILSSMKQINEIAASANQIHADLNHFSNKLSLIVFDQKKRLDIKQLADKHSDAVKSLPLYQWSLTSAGKESLNKIDEAILQGKGRVAAIINLLKEIKTSVSEDRNSQEYSKRQQSINEMGQLLEKMLPDIEKLTQDRVKPFSAFEIMRIVSRNFGKLSEAAHSAAQFAIDLEAVGNKHTDAILIEINALIRDFYLLADRLEMQFYLKEGYITSYPIFEIGNFKSINDIASHFVSRLKQSNREFDYKNQFPYVTAITEQRKAMLAEVKSDEFHQEFIQKRINTAVSQEDAASFVLDKKRQENIEKMKELIGLRLLELEKERSGYTLFFTKRKKEKILDSIRGLHSLMSAVALPGYGMKEIKNHIKQEAGATCQKNMWKNEKNLLQKLEKLDNATQTIRGRKIIGLKAEKRASKIIEDKGKGLIDGRTHELNSAWWVSPTKKRKIKLLKELKDYLKQDLPLDEAVNKIREDKELGEYAYLLYDGKTGKLMHQLHMQAMTKEQMIARIDLEIVRLAKPSKKNRFFSNSSKNSSENNQEVLEELHRQMSSNDNKELELNEHQISLLKKQHVDLWKDIVTWQGADIKPKR